LLPSTARSRLDLDGRVVLVIEDHDDSRDVLRQMVASFGATVLLARNGDEGMAQAVQTRPDLVFCDLVMPVRDGFSFIRRFLAREELRRVPVIAVTALGSQPDLMRTWKAGFRGHLVKPIDYEVVAAQLERIFRGAPERRARSGDDEPRLV
jgi:CheY-like chemotaxis protein